MSRRRSRSAMISASGRSKRWARTISSFSASAEVARVEEAGLRVDAGLGLELRHRQRAVDQEHRGDARTGSATGWRARRSRRTTPSAASTSSVERPWNEKRPDSRIECPWPSSSIGASIAWFRPTRTIEQASPATAKRRSVFGISAVGVKDALHGPPRRDRRDHVVADVEALPVPGRPVLQPGRDVLDDRHHDDQLRRQEQDRRDQEDVRRVVRLVAAACLTSATCASAAPPAKSTNVEPGARCCSLPSAAVRRTAPRRGRARMAIATRYAVAAIDSRRSSARARLRALAEERTRWERRSRRAHDRSLVPHVSLS